MLRRTFVILASALAATSVVAQSWPARPIKLIVNFPAGTGLDVLARAYGKQLSELLSQPVVIENKVGAGGNIGMEMVARATPDGYTLLWTPGSTLVTNMFIYKNYNTELAKSLEPVAVVFYQPLPLVVRADAPFRNAAELSKYAKANPDKLRYGSSGLGSPMHLGALMWMSQSGFMAQHVPYKSTGEAVMALMNGDIDFYFDAGPATPFVKQGKLRSLALAGSRRSAMHGDVPTMLEATGARVDTTLPGGLYAPPKTRASIIQTLHAASRTIWESKEYKDAIAPIYAEPSPAFASTKEIEAQLAADRERIGKLVRDANISLD